MELRSASQFRYEQGHLSCCQLHCFQFQCKSVRNMADIFLLPESHQSIEGLNGHTERFPFLFFQCNGCVQYLQCGIFVLLSDVGCCYHSWPTFCSVTLTDGVVVQKKTKFFVHWNPFNILIGKYSNGYVILLGQGYYLYIFGTLIADQDDYFNHWSQNYAQ